MIRKSGIVLEGIKCSGVHYSMECRVPFSHVLMLLLGISFLLLLEVSRMVMVCQESWCNNHMIKSCGLPIVL